MEFDTRNMLNIKCGNSIEIIFKVCQKVSPQKYACAYRIMG